MTLAVDCAVKPQYKQHKASILINATEALKLKSPKNDVLDKMWVIERIFGGIWPSFSDKKAVEETFEPAYEIWYLSHRRPANAHGGLHIRADTPEPFLFANIKYGSKQRVRPKIRHLAPLDG